MRAPESSAACKNSVESDGSKPQHDATTTVPLQCGPRRSTCAARSSAVITRGAGKLCPSAGPTTDHSSSKAAPGTSVEGSIAYVRGPKTKSSIEAARFVRARVRLFIREQGRRHWARGVPLIALRDTTVALFGISTTGTFPGIGIVLAELSDSVGNLLALRIVDDSGRPRGDWM